MTTTINADNGVSSGSAGLKSSADSSGALQLQTNGTAALTIDTSQNVGIGTTSPSARLHVAGGSLLLGASSGEGGEIDFQNAAGNANSAFLDVDSGNLFRIFNASNTATQFFTNSTERMRITSAGGVSFGAIGTAYGTSGQVLTSAGNAPPTWATPTTGTVTSVAASVPAFLSISGSPITSSGTLAITYSGTALPVANGGTGVTSSTGSGAVVLGTSPTLTTPTINSAQVATVSGTAALYFCRAWVNFNGTVATPSTIRGSGNVSSVTKNSTGQFTINFTTAMPDTNYAVTAGTVIQPVATNSGYNWACPDLASSATVSCKLIGFNGNTGTNPLFGDNAYYAVAVFR